MRRRVVASVWTQGLEQGSNADAVAFTYGARPGGGAEVAVADGVSSTLFAADWARTLVQGAVQGWGALAANDVAAQIEPLRESFDPLSDRPAASSMVRQAWLMEGSAATLLAATLGAREGGSRRLSATAVGDSVLMVLSGDAFSTFPPLSSSDFTSTPSLVSSVLGAPVSSIGWETELEGEALVLLSTDAVAAHLIRVVETDGPGGLRSLLAALVDGARRHGVRGTDLAGVLLHDTGQASFHDDATLVLCADVPDRDESDLDLLARAVDGSAQSHLQRVLEWLRRRVTTSKTTGSGPKRG